MLGAVQGTPKGCHLARIRNETDLDMIFNSIVERSPPRATAFRVGVLKDSNTIAAESVAGAALDVRREGWVNLDGSAVPSSVWADGAPFGLADEDPDTLVVSAAFVLGVGLTDKISSSDFNIYAVYECCPSKECKHFDFETHFF